VIRPVRTGRAGLKGEEKDRIITRNCRPNVYKSLDNRRAYQNSNMQIAWLEAVSRKKMGPGGG